MFDSFDFNWWLILICCSLSSAFLIGAVLVRRYLLLKPSTLFLAYYQASVMWPMLVWYDYATELVPDVRAMIIALHVFGLLATVTSLLTWNGAARSIQHRIVQTAGIGALRPQPQTAFLLWSIFITIAGWYIATLGWHNTGLYAIISGDDANAEVREYALKLLPNHILQYAWVIMSHAIAYLLAYLLSVEIILSFRHKRWTLAAFCGLAYLSVLLVVMLPGSRAPAVMVVLTTLFTLYVTTGFRIALGRIVMGIALILVLPAMISLLRNNETITLSNFWIYYVDILDRIAGRSVQDNIWIASYVQHEGFFGAKGIPVLARIVGIEPVDIFNTVGLYFVPDGIQSISSNSSFPAVNYACFGTPALLFSIGSILAMDSILWLQRGLLPSLAAPCAGICTMIAINFAMTSFSTVLITHGFVTVILICYSLQFIGQNSRFSIKPGFEAAG